MAKSLKTDKPEEAPATLNLDSMAEEASKRPDIYPKLKFGDGKLDEGAVIVRCVDVSPKEFRYDDPFTGEPEPGLALVVEVVESSFGHTGGMYSLTMKGDANHALTAGVLKAWKKEGKNLSGAHLKISTNVYKHKQFGDTRGYLVEVVSGIGA